MNFSPETSGYFCPDSFNRIFAPDGYLMTKTGIVTGQPTVECAGDITLSSLSRSLFGRFCHFAGLI